MSADAEHLSNYTVRPKLGYGAPCPYTAKGKFKFKLSLVEMDI